MKIPSLPYSEDKLFGFLFFISLLIPLAFSFFNYESFEIIKYALLLVLTGVALVAFCYKKSSELIFRGNKLFYFGLGLFWLWALLASIFSWDKNYSFFGFYPRFTSGLLFYSLWSILLLLLGFLNFQQIKFLLKTLVLTSGLIALWGLLESVGFGYYVGLTSEFFNRGAPSFLGNPNFSSMYVAAMVPLTLLFFYESTTLRFRIYYAVSIVLQLWSLVIFASRGALLGLMAGLLTALALTLLFRKWDWRWLLVLFIVLGLALGFNREFLNFARPETIAATVSFQDVNIQNRLGVWKLALGSLLKRPFVGVGLGNFQLMFEHDRSKPIITSGFFDDAHNLPLELAVTGGIPFALLFLFLIGSAVIDRLRQLSVSNNPEAVALLAALTAWFVASLFNPVVIACYLLLAVLISACFNQALRTPTGGFISPPSLKIFILVLGAILICYGCVFFSAEVLFFAGIRSYNANNFTRAYKEVTAAVWLNPVNRLYYVYQTGSAILEGQPPVKINGLLAATAKLNPRRSFSYIQNANLNYLLLYKTQNPAYRQAVINNLRQAILLDPFSSDNYFVSAQYKFAFRDLPGSLADLQAGLSIDPQSLEAEMFLAKIYQLQNNRAGLIEALTQANKIQPDDPEIIQLMRLAKKAPDIKILPFTINFNLGSLN